MKNRWPPKKWLRMRSRADDYVVRMTVADHPNCPLDVLSFLANDRDFQVLDSVLNHPKTTAKIMWKVFRQTRRRWRESKRGGTRDFWVTSSWVISVCRMLSNHPRCPLDLLYAIEDQFNVAPTSHPNYPPERRAFLALGAVP